MSSFVFSIFLLLPILLAQASNSSNTRIIDGEASANGQFPYAVGYYYVKGETTSFCGGSLLNNKWILTAAHCIIDATKFTIYIGTNNLQDAESNGLVVTSTEYVAHPSYNPNNLANDIGLILLDTPIEFTDNIRSIELSTQILADSVSVTAVGWGATSDAANSPSNILYYLSLTTITNRECFSILNSPVVRDSVVCVVGVGNQGTCRGDAGGPLVQIGSNGVTVQVGVSIFHAGGGCENNYPSGFIRTADYIDWITNESGITTPQPTTEPVVTDDSSSASTLIICLPIIFVYLILFI